MFQLFFFGFFIDFHHIWEMECCKLCEIESHFERGEGEWESHCEGESHCERGMVKVILRVGEGHFFRGRVMRVTLKVGITLREGGWESLWEREGESHSERGRATLRGREWEREGEREWEPLWGGESESERHDMLENQQWLLFWHKYMFQERSHTLTSHNWTATWHTDTNTSLDHTHIMAKKCNT